MHLSRIVCIVLTLLTSTLLLYILIHILTIRVQCNWHSVYKCVFVCECVYVCWVGTGPGFRITAAIFQYPPLHICNVHRYMEKQKNLDLKKQFGM